MSKFWISRVIGAFKNPRSSDISFEFDCPLESDLPKIAAIFYNAFSNAYRDIPPETMELPLGKTKEQFLKETMAEEIKAIQAGQVHCLVAKIHETPVAAVTFKLNLKTGNVYLSVLGVSPHIKMNDKSIGLGKQLLAVLEKRFNSLNGFDLYTRRFNQSAIGFYQHQDFIEKSPKELGIEVKETQYTGFERLFQRNNTVSLQRSHSLPDLDQVKLPVFKS